MSRFLSLFGVLTALKKNMESRSGHDPKQKKEFVTVMKYIDKEELMKLIHFLRPLVKGWLLSARLNTTTWCYSYAQ